MFASAATHIDHSNAANAASGTAKTHKNPADQVEGADELSALLLHEQKILSGIVSIGIVTASELSCFSVSPDHAHDVKDQETEFQEYENNCIRSGCSTQTNSQNHKIGDQALHEHILEPENEFVVDWEIDLANAQIIFIHELGRRAQRRREVVGRGIWVVVGVDA